MEVDLVVEDGDGLLEGVERLVFELHLLRDPRVILVQPVVLLRLLDVLVVVAQQQLF